MGRDLQANDWIPVTFLHGSQAKFIRHYVRKGDLVQLKGKIEVSTFKERDGTEKTNLRVIGSDIPRLTLSRNAGKDIAGD